jgi:hypothetical protein
LIGQTSDEASNNADLAYNFMRRDVVILVSFFRIARNEVVGMYYLRQRAEVLFGLDS